MKLCVLLVLLCAVFNCDALPEGAPPSACTSLTPVHSRSGSRIDAQNSDPPYVVTTENSGGKVKVIVSSPIGEEFMGFVLQARASVNRTKFIDGEFSESEVARAFNCFNSNKNTLTHKNPVAKKEIVTEWTPSSGVDEDVVFRATVAKTFDVFWTDIDSTPIKISGDGSISEATETSKQKAGSIYDDCFVSKGCFGMPTGCAERHDCQVLLTYARIENGVNFAMFGYLDSSEYMAMGLSEDAVMGDDAVTECIRQDSEVVARISWNEGRSNTRTNALERSMYTSNFFDGLSSCSWNKAFVFETNGRNFSLSHKNYYVLLAKGEVNNGGLTYHNSRLPSSAPVNFTAYEEIEGEGITSSVKVHGSTVSESTEFRDTTVPIGTEEHEAKPTSKNQSSDQRRNSSNFKLSLCLFLLSLACYFF